MNMKFTAYVVYIENIVKPIPKVMHRIGNILYIPTEEGFLEITS